MAFWRGFAMADATVAVAVDKLVVLAVEHWRLGVTLKPVMESAGAAPVRHALRKMEEVLKGLGVEVKSLDGLPYDAGLAARVVEMVEDAELTKGTARIVETLSPMVMWEGKVVRGAEVVVARN
jgi:hypothetical protein